MRGSLGHYKGKRNACIRTLPELPANDDVNYRYLVASNNPICWYYFGRWKCDYPIQIWQENFQV